MRDAPCQALGGPWNTRPSGEALTFHQQRKNPRVSACGCPREPSPRCLVSVVSFLAIPAPAPSCRTSIRCLCHTSQAIRKCALRPWRCAGSLGAVGPQVPLPEHQQLPEIPGFGLFGWGVSACSPQGLVPRRSVCPAGTGGVKWYDAFLTSPGLPCGAAGTPGGLRTTGPTSKVKLDVRRRGPGGQRGPGRRGSRFPPVRQAVLEALPRSVGFEQLCQNHPHPHPLL